MALTQCRASGTHAGSRYGSFDRSVSRDVGRLTDARAFGAHTGQRYGTFAGRTPQVTTGARTQLRAYGPHTGARYGAFSGRTAAPPQPPQPEVSHGWNRLRVPPDLRDLHHRKLLTEDELLLLMAAAAISSGIIH